MAKKPIKLGLDFGSKNKSRDILCAELDENYLKVVHLQQRGVRREFVNTVSHPVRGLFEEGLLLLLRQTLEQFQVQNPRVYLTVPLPLVITRNIEIPSQDPDEIKEIVNLQASRHTPYARAEIIVDMVNLGIVRERYSKILLVIVPKETVNKHIQLMERVGLRLEKVVFPPEAIAAAADKMMGKDAEGAPFVVIHMDYAFTNFIVVEASRILFVRGIHIGASHLTEERTSYVDRFQDELEKSLETYHSDEVGATPKALLLSGVLQNVTDFDDLFEDALHLKIKRVLYPEYFHMTEPAKKAVMSAKNVSFLNLLAPMAVFDRLKVDLTSEEKKLKIQLERRAKEMLKTGILTMIFLSLIFADVTSRISFKKAFLKQVTTHYLPVREGAKQLEQMLSKTELVKSYLISRGNSLKALTELYDATPLEIRLTEIKYDSSSQKFSVKGTSSVMSSVFSFVSDLEKSASFKNVKTKYVTSRSEAGRDLADFEVNCLIEAAGPQKTEAPKK